MRLWWWILAPEAVLFVGAVMAVCVVLLMAIKSWNKSGLAKRGK